MKIAVITITYHAERTLKRTLDSVASQHHRPIAHYIIDGASTDRTLTIAQRYKAAAPYEVTIVSEPDRGLYDAMNKGLRCADGDYVVFLNAGDTFYDSDTLETVAHAAEQHAVADTRHELPAVIYGDTAIVDAYGVFLHQRRHRPPEQLTWRSFKHGMLVCHQAFYARLDIARQTPYDLRYRHSADVDWCIRVMKEAERQRLALVNTHAVLANFEDGGNTTQHHRASLVERFRVMAHHYGLLQTILLHAWFVVRSIVK